jgi:hydroxymethylbilane synthase
VSEIVKTFKVGTRDSILARLQTDLALQAVSAKFPDLKFEILAVKTSGDKILNKPLAELGGRGVFVKELEEALLESKVDFVVHSLKDLPTVMPDGLTLAATIDRADPRDVLVSREGLKFAELPIGARVATSSRRRTAQLLVLRQDLNFVDIRGNIQTRMRKLEEDQCDAMVLAAAGLHRLGLTDRIAEYLDLDKSTPAVGQGAMGIECRDDNTEILEILQAVNEKDLWNCVTAERAFLNVLGGGCSVPVGAIAEIVDDDRLELRVCIASLDGHKVYRRKASGPVNNAEEIGSALAKQLVDEGAAEIINALLRTNASVSPP